MLVLSRKKGESIMIGDHIELIILGTEGDSVRIGINAPKHIEIHRKEVFIAIKQSNEEASKSRIALTALGELFKKRDQ
ncbi:carbon storage regulator CsrA [Paenibacillus hamazuiensis]|uniref:carbon storage regulator CsrA n=1 Tax=Paenibacillus hamazuiensis TaxID=2936508 RepID=UPI00200CF8A8